MVHAKWVLIAALFVNILLPPTLAREYNDTSALVKAIVQKKKTVKKSQEQVGDIVVRRKKAVSKRSSRKNKSMTVRRAIEEAVAITHVPPSWVQPMKWIAFRESTNNPRAVAYESTCGEYAQGLMQMIPTTFAAYALPHMKNIWSPLDNAVASIRYIQSRYGYPWAIPGLETNNYSGY